MKFKTPDGAWAAEGTRAKTKAEARALLVEVEQRAERQRLGLEPRTRDPEGWYVRDLLRWWLDEYSRHLSAHDKNVSAVYRHLLGAPLAGKRLEQVAAADIEELLQAKQDEVGPATVNHLRRFLVRA